MVRSEFEHLRASLGKCFVGVLGDFDDSIVLGLVGLHTIGD